MGSYGCEVSSEGPSFLTIYGEANMSVAIPPNEPPSLRGLRPSYEAGETLQAECSSAASYPPARLVFILNGKEVKQVLTRELPSSSSTEDTMVSSSRLGLTLHLERQHFPGGTLTLGCQSTLPGIVGAKSFERTETATLAASNQRLAQEPPRSGCVVNLPSSVLATVCCFLLRSFNYGILTFPYLSTYERLSLIEKTSGTDFAEFTVLFLFEPTLSHCPLPPASSRWKHLTSVAVHDECSSRPANSHSVYTASKNTSKTTLRLTSCLQIV
ncbi:hypothetical protein E2986_11450 [Frieseomelitta varia]|uniref:CD80-like immunoglobulin C2-set domain-containing protein n=1 Tax=Frieseomelitta varia TaxID=561572 RepID=A0A833RV56_9HYME|nr:hypothetical protein E2986_11450 [Frieseomelitta varia]